jgi:hypothetical protein
MEGNGTSATAMLVGTPEDVGGRPDAATVTLAREEIEEALASDAPLELILTVDRGSSTKDVRVAWERSDLEKVLAGADADGITFSFDRAELHRALEHPDFEGHGIREMVILTVAAASASAALAASTASAQLLDTEGGGGGGTTVTAVQPGDPGTIPYLSQGVGVDQSQFQGEASTAGTQAEPGTIPYLSQGIGVDQSQFQGEASTAGTQGEAGTIPYLSQGIGVDQSQFQGEASTPAIHDEATAAQRGVGQTVPGNDEATLMARGVDPAIATAMASHGEAATASDLANLAGIHDETTLAARGVDQIVPGADEASLAARGIHTPAVHDEGTLVTRGIESEPAVPADSGTSFEMPALDSGTAAAIGGLAGAGLLIVGASFMARRRTTPV